MSRLLYRYFEDLAVGEREATRGRTVTEADIVMWCAVTGDWFRLHTDKVYAERSMFGQRIAPGIMTLAFSAGLVVPPDSENILANYGMDKLRYPAPTYIGDTIHAELEVTQKQERDATSGVVDFDWNVINQNGRTVLSSTLKVLMRRRQGEG